MPQRRLRQLLRYLRKRAYRQLEASWLAGISSDKIWSSHIASKSERYSVEYQPGTRSDSQLGWFARVHSLSRRLGDSAARII